MVTGISVGDNNDAGRRGTGGKATTVTVAIEDEDIPAAYILPSSTKAEIAELLEMSLNDLQSTRIGPFLCKRIEESFDELALSFVPIDILHPSEYKMVIWKNSYKNKFVIKGRTEIIGTYNGICLKIGK